MAAAEDSHEHEKYVGHNFILRARLLNPATPNAAWDVSTTRNISKAGVLFYSSNYYNYNADVEIKIKSPIIPEEMVCRGKVVRCDLLKDMRHVYGVTVEITAVTPQSREAYDKMMKLFIDKPEQPK